MDRGGWLAEVCGVIKILTWLRDWAYTHLELKTKPEVSGGGGEDGLRINWFFWMSWLDIGIWLKFSKYFKIWITAKFHWKREFVFSKSPGYCQKKEQGKRQEVFFCFFFVFNKWAFITFREEEAKIWTFLSLIFILFHNCLILLKGAFKTHKI